MTVESSHFETKIEIDDQSFDSADTNEAFMEMLGLTNLRIVDDNNEFEDEEEDLTHDSTCIQSQDVKVMYDIINLPSRCSRHLLPPSSCLALVIDNVLSEQQCNYLIEKAHESSTGFRYITEATHKALDGSSYTVQIQNPNPHKLAVVDTGHDPFSSQHNSDELQKNFHDLEATLIMDQLYITISSILNESNLDYQKFTSRTNCGKHQGLNPRMRILKYDAENNDRFEAHFDATTFVPSSSKSNNHNDNGKNHNIRRQSLITVLVYLNNGNGQDFEGGETMYLNYHNSCTTKTNSVDLEGSVKVTPKVGRVVLFEHDLFHSGSPLQTGTKYIMRTDVLFQEQHNEHTHTNIPLSNNANTLTNSIRSDDLQQLDLVSDLCKKINMTPNEIQIISDMDLLFISIDAFISPGLTSLQMMLIDAGLHRDVVATLIQHAVSLIKKK